MSPHPTRPAPYAQGDGSWAQWLNCVLAACTMLMHRTSVGRWRVPAWRLRTITGDNVGGVTLADAAAAVAKATSGKIKLEPLYAVTRFNLRAMSRAGHGLLVIINCARTVRTARATNRFTGLHAVYVNQWRWVREATPLETRRRCACERDTGQPHGEYLVEDPGTTSAGFKWWSARLLHEAAEARIGGAPGSKSINVLVGADTEGVNRIASDRVVIRRQPDKTSKILGHTVKGRSYRQTHTTNGSDWTAADGGKRDNWSEIPWGDGEAFVRGEGLEAS